VKGCQSKDNALKNKGGEESGYEMKEDLQAWLQMDWRGDENLSDRPDVTTNRWGNPSYSSITLLA
jgi:hypothetical protein